jgi:hypothetical protein
VSDQKPQASDQGEKGGRCGTRTHDLSRVKRIWTTPPPAQIGLTSTFTTQPSALFCAVYRPLTDEIRTKGQRLGDAFSSIVRLFPCPSVDPPGIEVHQHLPELLVVENPLEDGLVVVHPSHDRPMNIRSKTCRKFSMVLFWT